MHATTLSTLLSPNLYYQVGRRSTGRSRWCSVLLQSEHCMLKTNRSKTCRQLEVAHRAVAKFLFISVTFETQLRVWEDDENRKIRFTNAREG